MQITMLHQLVCLNNTRSPSAALWMYKTSSDMCEHTENKTFVQVTPGLHLKHPYKLFCINKIKKELPKMTQQLLGSTSLILLVWIYTLNFFPPQYKETEGYLPQKFSANNEIQIKGWQTMFWCSYSNRQMNWPLLTCMKWNFSWANKIWWEEQIIMFL